MIKVCTKVERNRAITCKLSKVKLGENYPEPSTTLKHVQGHKVNHRNRNNSAADCSIAFNEVEVTAYKVMYQQQKRYRHNTAMYRLGDIKLAMAS